MATTVLLLWSIAHRQKLQSRKIAVAVGRKWRFRKNVRRYSDKSTSRPQIEKQEDVAEPWYSSVHSKIKMYSVADVLIGLSVWKFMLFTAEAILVEATCNVGTRSRYSADVAWLCTPWDETHVHVQSVLEAYSGLNWTHTSTQAVQYSYSMVTTPLYWMMLPFVCFVVLRVPDWITASAANNAPADGGAVGGDESKGKSALSASTNASVSKKEAKGFFESPWEYIVHDRHTQLSFSGDNFNALLALHEQLKPLEVTAGNAEDGSAVVQFDTLSAEHRWMGSKSVEHYACIFLYVERTVHHHCTLLHEVTAPRGMRCVCAQLLPAAPPSLNPWHTVPSRQHIPPGNVPHETSAVFRCARAC